MKQPEACTVVAVNDAATLASMPMLRFWVGFATFWRPCPMRAVRPAEAAMIDAASASSGSNCVCLPHGSSDEAWVH